MVRHVQAIATTRLMEMLSRLSRYSPVHLAVGAVQVPHASSRAAEPLPRFDSVRSGNGGGTAYRHLPGCALSYSRSRPHVRYSVYSVYSLLCCPEATSIALTLKHLMALTKKLAQR